MTYIQGAVHTPYPQTCTSFISASQPPDATVLESMAFTLLPLHCGSCNCWLKRRTEIQVTFDLETPCETPPHLVNHTWSELTLEDLVCRKFTMGHK